MASVSSKSLSVAPGHVQASIRSDVCKIVFLVCIAACHAIPASAQSSRYRELLKGVDLQGQLRRLGNEDETDAVVVVFLSTQCPISNSYLPALNQLHSTYRQVGIEFYGVISDAAVSRSAAVEHSRKFKVQFPVLFDGSGELRLALAPTHTPQVFVLDREGRHVYSGAIDDRYVKLGRKKEVAERHFLIDAINAVSVGRDVTVSRTKPIGCRLEDPPNKARTGEVTFARDIAPIIQANCAACHRPNQSGPFPLLSYDDVSGHALQIQEVTESRFMPPWKPAPGFRRFLDEQRLSKNEIELLNSWVASGKPMGDPDDLPAATEYIEGWPLGEPDLVLQMNEPFSIPASGPDLRHYFVIPTGFVEDRMISAIDFRPGTPQSVHHASFFLDTTGTGRRHDRDDPTPGYEGFGGPRIPSQGTLSSWFPGMMPRRLPAGMGRRVPKKSDIIAEIHYVTTGKPERDQSKIGVYFADRTARQVVTELQVGTKRIEIPAGATRHKVQSFYSLPVDVTLMDLVPHMHLLGREIKVWADLPDGSTKALLWIKDWDFNWQGQYSFAHPVRLAKGSRIHVDAWYDNSTENPLNPNSPPKVVRWGEDADDEMLLCSFQCTCDTMDELNQLTESQMRYISGARNR